MRAPGLRDMSLFGLNHQVCRCILMRSGIPFCRPVAPGSSGLSDAIVLQTAIPMRKSGDRSLAVLFRGFLCKAVPSTVSESGSERPLPGFSDLLPHKMHQDKTGTVRTHQPLFLL